MPVPWIATARTRGAASKRSSGSLLRVMMPSESAARLRMVSGALSGARTTSALAGEQLFAGGGDRVDDQDAPHNGSQEKTSCERSSG